MDNTFRMEKLYPLIIVAAAFLVYANSLFNGFVLDDQSVILNNPLIKGDISSLFYSIDTTGESQLLPFYRPFTYLSFMLEWKIHGLNLLYVRLLNVALHAANSYLVYALIKRLFNIDDKTALLAGLLFAVHPINSEVVNFNAGGRNTMLACLLSISSIILFIKSDLSRRYILTLPAAALFLAALFSKELAFMSLPIFIFSEWQFSLNRLSRKGFLQSFIKLIPIFAAAAVYLYFRWMTLSKLGIQTSLIPGVGTSMLDTMYVTSDLATRLSNNFFIIPRHFLSIILPITLAPRYVIPEDISLHIVPMVTGWLLIIVFSIFLLAKKEKTITLSGLLWSILYWLPVSGIVLVPGAPFADRFLYIPAIGLWVIIANQFQELLKVKPYLKRIAYVSASIVLMILGGLTVKRNFDWKDDFSIYSRFAKQYPENPHAHAGLGKVYYGDSNHKNMLLAEQEFVKTAEIDPNFQMIFTYIGNIRLNKGDMQGALNAYNRALEVYPYDKEALINRGITKENLGKPKEALADYIMFKAVPGSDSQLPGGIEHIERKIRELSQQ